MNALLHTRNSLPLQTTPAIRLSADLSQVEARKRSLQRTVQALFRERLLFEEHLIVEGTVSWLPLWLQQGLLRFEGLQVGRIGNCELQGSVSFYRTGARPQPLATASALLACIAPSVAAAASADDLQRLIQELDNSVENDALCLNFRRTWRNELAEITQGGNNFIAALRNAGLTNPVLLLEQWGTLGHPWHPTYKTKLGLTTNDVVALSPEFSPTLNIPVAAIHADKAHATFAQDTGDYRLWFARTFPDVSRRWEACLTQHAQDPQHWLPLPLHPYQAQQLIPQKFAEELEAGHLLLLPGVDVPASPTMSFRTVVPEGSSELPHMKLPVSLRLTSVQRTVSPKSAVMGPRLTRLLTTIVAREHGFGGVLDIVEEAVGVHYIDPDNNDDRARHLAVLFRVNPMTKRTEELFPVPVGCLFADSPLGGRPLVSDLVARSFGDHADGALQFFRKYADTVVSATLGAYLLYGIAFEAHQQNSFIMVDNSLAPVRLLVRDFGDLRVHAPTLQHAGHALVPYREGHTVFESNEPVRDKLLHAVLLCHLSELALLLARTYALSEDRLWKILRQEIENTFDRLQTRTESQRWAAERYALLEADWPAKSFLRMRLSDTSDDVHGHMANPLRTAR
ncbi:MAG TPA: IucA/IucC family protein [Noviherbaspirillum sp.]|nr:IucA/IucC family protein [Noviherbaspirillum sp.]